MRRRRTVLALVTGAYRASGGIAQYNRDLFGALSEMGDWRVEVLPRLADGPRFAIPTAVDERRPRLGRLAFSLRALYLAARLRPDVVFCGHLFMAPLAAAAAMLIRARLIVQVHGIESWKRPGLALRLSVRRSDQVACVSRDTRARILAWSKLPESRTTLLPNTVTAAFTPGNRSAARLRFGVEDRLVLLSVGRLDARERYKGHDRVIAELPRLISAHPDLIYLIAGDGDDRPRLETLALEAAVEGQVRFLGAVETEALPDLYRAADLFVLPSTGEGFGIVFLEAMACGTPALGLAVGGAPDALADGALGVCVAEAGFPLALDRALAKPPPSGEVLASAVRARFGAAAFNWGVEALMHRVFATTEP